MADNVIDAAILRIETDLSDVNKKLGRLEKDTKTRAGRIGKTLGAAFTTFASAKALGAIRNLFSGAVQTANRFENALLGLKAAAEGAGLPFEQVREKVIALTRDGTLGIENVANSFKLLLAQGVQTDKAFELTQAVKRIASLNNIVGSTSQATQDFFKGVLTGSAELVENADPAIRGIVKRYGGLAKVSTDAATQQKFFNEIIERGNELAGAYEETLDTGQGALTRFQAAQEGLNATIGKAVQGPYKALLVAGTGILNSVNNLVAGLGPLGQTILTLGSGLAAIAPAAVGFATGLNEIIRLGGTLGITLKGLTSFLTGPFGIALAGIAAAIGVFSVATGLLGESSKESAEAAASQFKEFGQLEKRLVSVRDKSKKTAADKKFLADTNVKLAEAANDLGISLRNENGELKTQLDLIREIRSEREKEVRARIAELKLKEQELQAEVRTGRSLTRGVGGQLVRTTGSRTRSASIRATARRFLAETQQEIATLELSLQDTTNTVQRSSRRNSQIIESEFKGVTDFFQTDFERSFEGILTEFDKFQKSLKKSVEKGQIDASTALILSDEGRARLNEQIADLIQSQETAILQFNEEREKIEIESTQKIFDERERFLRDLFNLGKINEEELADERIKLEKSLQKKLAKTRLDSVRKTVDQIDDVISAVASGLEQLQEGTLSGALGGLSGIAGAIPGGELIGTILSIGSAIAGLFEGLLDNSEEIEKQEELQKKQIEEQNRLLEKQQRITKILADLNAQRNKFLTEEARRQIRVNNLTLDANRARQQNLRVLQDLAQTRAGQLGLEDAEPGKIASFIGRTERVAASTQAVFEQIRALGQVQRNESTGSLMIRIIQLNKIIEDIPDITPRVRGVITGLRDRIQGIVDIRKKLERGEGLRSDVLTLSGVRSDVLALSESFTSAEAFFQGTERFFTSHIQQQQEGLDNANELLSLLEEIDSVQSKVAETARSIQLREGRRVSLIDVGLRAVQDITGQRIGFQRPDLTLPTGVSGTAVAGPVTKSFQQRQAESLENILNESREQTALLAAIAQSLRGSPGQVSDAQIQALVVRAFDELGELQIQ